MLHTAVAGCGVWRAFNPREHRIEADNLFPINMAELQPDKYNLGVSESCRKKKQSIRHSLVGKTRHLQLLIAIQPWRNAFSLTTTAI